jgi:ubiquinone/menaquinone biosynthesis C-methylase UbiE
VRTVQQARAHSADSTARAVFAADQVLPGAPAVDRDYLERNRHAWERWAPEYIAAGRSAWQADELRWGMWETPESDLGLVEGFAPGDYAIDLGCGTAEVSAWLARRGLQPVAVDFANAQIRAAETFQREFDLSFPLIRERAERVPFDDDSFDLAVSAYGPSVWSDPRLWLPEAHRLLRPEGRLVFLTTSALLLTCTPPDGGIPDGRLVRNYFQRFRVEFGLNGAVEFHLSHGNWIRLLRASGFVLDDLIEVRPHPDAEPRFAHVSREWAQRWPSEEIWIAHKT